MSVLSLHLLLSVFFLSGASAACSLTSALNITTPAQMEALTGSCLQIPCSFKPVTKQTPQPTFDGPRTFGVWIKENHAFDKKQENVIFNSSNSNVNKYPMNIIGNLSQTNCTTLFSNLTSQYTDKYFFRIETGSFMATDVCRFLKINVTDSAPVPKIKVSGVLRDTESVTITCSAPTPCPQSPPQLTWNLQQHPDKVTMMNTNGTFTTKIQVNITLSDQNDGDNISCIARYPVNGGDKIAQNSTTLDVQYSPKNTSVSVSPLGLLSAGVYVNLTCSSKAKPPVHRFTWFRKSPDGVMNVSEGDFYSFQITRGAVYYCVATNNLGYKQSLEIRLILEGEALQWEPIVGGIIGIIVLIFIFMIVYIWHSKSSHSAAQHTESQPGDNLVVHEEQDDVKYGEIHFYQHGPGLSSDKQKDRAEQQDTVYAQVNVSQTANSSSQTADVSEALYAQVGKKPTTVWSV